jgi:pimeloyl-ACP methyl ester carboxylesterase
MDGPLHPQVVPVNGTELTYVEAGNGDPVILVHGTTCDFRTWRDQLTPIGKHYRAITYSRRAHYPNAWPDDYVACTPELHAADLAALIETLGLGSVHVFGHSYGGLVSLVLATRRPDLVRTLVLGEPPLFSWLAAMPERAKLLEVFVADIWDPARQACQRGEVEAATHIFLDGVIGDGAYDACPPEVQVAMLDNGAEMCVELSTPLGVANSLLSRDDVKRVQVPTLLLTGELSPPLFPAVIDELAQCLPQAERVVIPGASHDLGDPAQISAMILTFLAKHG